MTSTSYGGQVRYRNNELEYVYILMCSNNKTYVGHTADLDERINRHMKVQVTATKNILPVKLLTFIVFSDKYKAIEFEKYLKSCSGRAFLKKRLI